MVTIFGHSVPQAAITVSVHSSVEILKNVTADVSGAWLYKLDTSGLDYGSHSTKAVASTDSDITAYSQVLSFVVGTVSKSSLVTVVDASHDPNKDGRVNIQDFSLMAYWYKRPTPPKDLDLNHDGKIDLIDFSILAYYWTG